MKPRNPIFTWTSKAVLGAGRAFPRDESWLVSPMSFLTALAPLARLRRELRKELLRLYPECKDSVKDLAKCLQTGQKLWAKSIVMWGCVAANDKAVSSSKLKSVAKAFNIDTFRCNEAKRAQIAAEINKKVKKATKGTILNPVESIDGSLMIVNVIFFHDEWVTPFLQEMTINDKWRFPDGSDKMCRFMENYIDCELWKLPGFECVTLEYIGGMRMSIFLPSSPSAEYEVSEEVIESALAPREKQVVFVSIPKWTFEKKDVSPERWLQECGCAASLEDTCVRQSVRIDVNEEGTTAAAITVIDTSGEEYDPDAPRFHADHPFAYALWDANGIFFFGHLWEP